MVVNLYMLCCYSVEVEVVPSDAYVEASCDAEVPDYTNRVKSENVHSTILIIYKLYDVIDVCWVSCFIDFVTLIEKSVQCLQNLLLYF